MMTLDEAIKYHEEMSRERYLNDGSHKQYAEWLKELKQFRQHREEDYSYHTGYTQRNKAYKKYMKKYVKNHMDEIGLKDGGYAGD